MTIPKLTPYTGQVANPDGSQTQTEFTQNMFDQLSYEATLATELDATVDGMNQAVTDVEGNANAASASATAAEAAASTAGYKGLWPDTGGSALKGETWQTQVGGTPTGEYYTALQNTSVDPVGDDVNWKIAGTIGQQNLSDYTDIVYKASGGNSAVENMAAGIPVAVREGYIVSTGTTTWKVASIDNGGLPLDNGLYANPISDVHAQDWGVDTTGATVEDSKIQAAVDVANNFGVFCILPVGDILIREVEHYGESKIKGNSLRGTNLIIDDNISHNRGLWGELVSIAETGLVLEDVTFKAKSTGIGYGWSLTRFAFVKSRNVRFVNLARGENFEDVLISRFVEHYYKSCVAGSYAFGELGQNINKYEHPISRNCTDTYIIEGNPANANASYGTTWEDGDFEYNERVFNISALGQSPHVAENCTFEGNSGNASEANLIKVTGDGWLELRDAKVGDTSASSLPNIISSDSDGTIDITGKLGKQTSSLRMRVPKKGTYNGTSLLRDNGLTDLPYELGGVKLGRNLFTSVSSFSESEIRSFASGRSPVGVKRVSSFINSSGWESGASTPVADPVGGNGAFEVTTQARMISTIPTSGFSVVQFFAMSTRGDSGSIDVVVQEATTNTTIGVISLNYNGTSGWKLFSMTIDAGSISGFDGSVRLIFPAVSGIRYWGQQIASGTKQPVPILPYNINYPEGAEVHGVGVATPMNQHSQINEAPFAVAQTVNTQALVKASDGNQAKCFEVTVVTFWTGTALTEVYHVALSYLLTADPTASINLISSNRVGASGSSRVSLSITNLTANSEKAIRITGDVFVNELHVKVRPLW